MEVAGCHLDLDLKTGTTGAEQGRLAPEVSTKQPLPKKKKPSYHHHHHHHYTITTFTLYDKGNFEFSWSVDVKFFSLSLCICILRLSSLSSGFLFCHCFYTLLSLSFIFFLFFFLNLSKPPIGMLRNEFVALSYVVSLLTQCSTYTSDMLVQSTTSHSLWLSLPLPPLCSFSWPSCVY